MPKPVQSSSKPSSRLRSSKSLKSQEPDSHLALAVKQGTPVDLKRLDAARKFSNELQDIQDLLKTVEKEFGQVENIRKYNRQCKQL
jgi:hypothetical protein